MWRRSRCTGSGTRIWRSDLCRIDQLVGLSDRGRRRKVAAASPRATPAFPSIDARTRPSVERRIGTDNRANAYASRVTTIAETGRPVADGTRAVLQDLYSQLDGTR